MTSDELAESLINEIIAEEQAALAGPSCEDGQHDVRQRPLFREGGAVLDPTWGTCKTCRRTVTRESEAHAWKAYCGTGCECRECRTRWSKPTEAPARFDMSAVSEGSLVTMDDDHRCGENGSMGSGGAQGRWRVTSFWRKARKGEWDTLRYEGQNLVRCEPSEALYVSLYSVCGTMLRADDFQAHATIDGHLSSNPAAPA